MNNYIENGERIDKIFDHKLESMDNTEFTLWLSRAFGAMSMCIPDEHIEKVCNMLEK